MKKALYNPYPFNFTDFHLWSLSITEGAQNTLSNHSIFTFLFCVLFIPIYPYDFTAIPFCLSHLNQVSNVFKLYHFVWGFVKCVFLYMYFSFMETVRCSKIHSVSNFSRAFKFHPCCYACF